MNEDEWAALDLDDLLKFTSDRVNELTDLRMIGVVEKSGAYQHLINLLVGRAYRLAGTTDLIADTEQISEDAYASFNRVFHQYLHITVVFSLVDSIREAIALQAQRERPQEARHGLTTQKQWLGILTEAFLNIQKENSLLFADKGRKPGKTSTELDRERQEFFQDYDELERRAHDARSPSYEADRKRFRLKKKKFGTKKR